MNVDAILEELIESLGFECRDNINFDGKVIYDDKKIPLWTYDNSDIEYKEELCTFLSGAIYWKVHTSLKGDNE